MLHDLIFALLGNPGSIFKETSSGNIEVVAGLPFISPSEEATLNRLLVLGTRFMFFEKFIQLHTSTLYGPGEKAGVSIDGLRQGCYLKAFCLGLDKVLSQYRQCLLNIEKEILADCHLSLMYIQCQTEVYHILFDALSDVITTIRTRKSHGCEILDILHKSTRSGNMLVKEKMTAIMKSCHVVMYKQLSSWLLHGLLIDRHGEFFVTKERAEVSKKFEKNTTEEKKLQEQYSSEFRDDFVVCLKFLPAYIPPRIAQVICFIGSSLHLFKSEEYYAINDSLKTNLQLSDVKKSSIINFKLNGILEEKESEFLADLQSLQQADQFKVEDFERYIGKIRYAVAKELWELCVEQAQLVSHLNMLKDFFLLGCGELFLVFIDEAGPLLKNPPSRVTEHDVQQAFLRSAAKLQIEDEIPFHLFHLTVNTTPEANSNAISPYVNIHTIDDGWARLGMHFKVKWPLHTIFKSHILEKYDQLFKFLLRVRRTQAALLRVWSVQMRKRQEIDIKNDSKINPSYETNVSERLQWRCRSQMQFFADNLQYYLQVDVLESHFTHLLHKIRTTDEALRDFESITAAHENFLNALLSQCFVMSKPVCRSLIEILDLCQKFCDVVITSSLLVSKEDVHQQVTDIWELYSKKTFVFFQVLNGVVTSQSNPHISQLTLRLDYNRFYSAMITKSKEATKTLF